MCKNQHKLPSCRVLSVGRERVERGADIVGTASSTKINSQLAFTTSAGGKH